jgi:superfamily I DNA/RNA helicase
MNHLGIHTLLEVESRAKVLLRYVNSIRPDETDALTYLKKSFTEILPLLQLHMDEIPTLQQHWDSFFESATRRLDNPDFNYAKDTENFKRLFNHREGVVVNTCHGIKGDEFHTVIAFGLLYGYLPNWNEEDKKEAAMRLLYVICSRSKVHLHLIAEKGRSTTNGNPYRTTDLLRELVYDYDVI